MRSEKKKFLVEDNLQLVGELYGEPGNELVLLLHGGGQTRHSWDITARALAGQGWQVLTYDARGHGESDWSPAGDYLWDALISDLRIILGHFAQKPVVIGASMGGLTALGLQGYATEQLFRALVLVDISPKQNKDGVQRIFDFMEANLDGFNDLEEVISAVDRYLEHRARPTDVEKLKKSLRIRNGKYYWHWDPKILTAWKNTRSQDLSKESRNLTEITRSLTVPVLVVRGEYSDVLTENIGSEFLKAVPHLETVVIPKAGHMVAGDNNDVFMTGIIEFLRKLNNSGNQNAHPEHL